MSPAGRLHPDDVAQAEALGKALAFLDMVERRLDALDAKLDRIESALDVLPRTTVETCPETKGGSRCQLFVGHVGPHSHLFKSGMFHWGEPSRFSE